MNPENNLLHKCHGTRDFTSDPLVTPASSCWAQDANTSQESKLSSRARSRSMTYGPVCSYFLQASAKPFLLIALALTYPRQPPCRAHNQHLNQLHMLPLFSDLLGCAPDHPINSSLGNRATHEIPELSKKSPSHPRPLSTVFPACALRIARYQTLKSEANPIFLPFSRTAVL